MKIGFGSDHAAIELKACLLEHLQSKGYECVDYGAYSPDQKVDYPIAGEVYWYAEQASVSLLQQTRSPASARVSARTASQPRW